MWSFRASKTRQATFSAATLPSGTTDFGVPTSPRRMTDAGIGRQHRRTRRSTPPCDVGGRAIPSQRQHHTQVGTLLE
jgi:hypothetical protein